MSKHNSPTPALFLDRDGTVIVDKIYLSDPNGIDIIPGAADAIRSINRIGWKVVIVSNQSGIARGMYSEKDCDAVNDELSRRLKTLGAVIDAVYYCPYHKDGTVEKYAKESNDRKPAPGMAFRAAADLGIDLSKSWMIGDRADDIRFALNAGMSGAVLVETGQGWTDENKSAVDALAAETKRMTVLRSPDIGSAVSAIVDALT